MELFYNLSMSTNKELPNLKNKEFSNTRSKSSDEAITLPKARTFSLEEALEFIESDELVEVTPDAIRLRKKILDQKERFRSNR